MDASSATYVTVHASQYPSEPDYLQRLTDELRDMETGPPQVHVRSMRAGALAYPSPAFSSPRVLTQRDVLEWLGWHLDHPMAPDLTPTGTGDPLAGVYGLAQRTYEQTMSDIDAVLED